MYDTTVQHPSASIVEIVFIFSSDWKRQWRRTGVPTIILSKSAADITWQYNYTYGSTKQKFSHPNLRKSFPLFFHRLILFESLWSLTISVALCCVAPWSSAPRLFCLLKVFGVELAHDTHYVRTGANSFPRRHCLSPGFCSPKTKKSQLTPETRESSAARVRVRVWTPALIYCAISCSSALWDFVPQPSNFKLPIYHPQLSLPTSFSALNRAT